MLFKCKSCGLFKDLEGEDGVQKVGLQGNFNSKKIKSLQIKIIIFVLFDSIRLDFTHIYRHFWQ